MTAVVTNHSVAFIILNYSGFNRFTLNHCYIKLNCSQRLHSSQPIVPFIVDGSKFKIQSLALVQICVQTFTDLLSQALCRLSSLSRLDLHYPISTAGLESMSELRTQCYSALLSLTNRRPPNQEDKFEFLRYLMTAISAYYERRKSTRRHRAHAFGYCDRHHTQMQDT